MHWVLTFQISHWSNNYSLSKCSRPEYHARYAPSYQCYLKFSQTMASTPSLILSITFWASISIGQRAVQIPFCCAGDSILDINSYKCTRIETTDERMFMFPGQNEPLTEKQEESIKSVKSLTFSQVNFHGNGEIESFNVNLSIPKDTLTKRFNCDFQTSRLVYNFTNLNSEEEQVLFDSNTLTTHDQYCIDAVKTNQKYTTIGLVCDPCTPENPCVSVCTKAAKEFSQGKSDGNFTRVVNELPCSNPMTLSSEFFSITDLGFVKVHEITLRYKDYCLLDDDMLNVCKDKLINTIDMSEEVRMSHLLWCQMD